MTRLEFIAGLIVCATTPAMGQIGKKKFYITGLAHTKTANDCTIPPIVAYGTDRASALLGWCVEGGLTVWTEEEYADMRKSIGAEFDKECKAQFGGEL